MKKKLIKYLFKKLFLPNNKEYYDNYTNSLDMIPLIMSNLLQPGRTLTRLKYKRFPVAKNFNKEEITNSLCVDFSNGINSTNFSEALEKIIRYGGVVLQNYFLKSEVDQFLEIYQEDFNTILLKKKNIHSFLSSPLPLNEFLIGWFTDKTIISLLKQYLNRLPYAREYPASQWMNPMFEKGKLIKQDGFSTEWHLDHTLLIQASVYLTDVMQDGSCMQILPGTHRFPATSMGYLSEEYVNNRKLETLNCYGSAGSVQIHCGNVFHRFRPRPNSARAWMKFAYTSGNSIHLDSKKIGQSLISGFDLDSLNEEQKEILRGLYPRLIPKGVEIHKTFLRQTTFKGI